jgi:hypothetical protein
MADVNPPVGRSGGEKLARDAKAALAREEAALEDAGKAVTSVEGTAAEVKALRGRLSKIMRGVVDAIGKGETPPLGRNAGATLSALERHGILESVPGGGRELTALGRQVAGLEQAATEAERLGKRAQAAQERIRGVEQYDQPIGPPRKVRYRVRPRKAGGATLGIFDLQANRFGSENFLSRARADIVAGIGNETGRLPSQYGAEVERQAARQRREAQRAEKQRAVDAERAAQRARYRQHLAAPTDMRDFAAKLRRETYEGAAKLGEQQGARPPGISDAEWSGLRRARISQADEAAGKRAPWIERSSATHLEAVRRVSQNVGDVKTTEFIDRLLQSRMAAAVDEATAPAKRARAKPNQYAEPIGPDKNRFLREAKSRTAAEHRAAVEENQQAQELARQRDGQLKAARTKLRKLNDTPSWMLPTSGDRESHARRTELAEAAVPRAEEKAREARAAAKRAADRATETAVVAKDARVRANAARDAAAPPPKQTAADPEAARTKAQEEGAKKRATLRKAEGQDVKKALGDSAKDVEAAAKRNEADVIAAQQRNAEHQRRVAAGQVPPVGSPEAEAAAAQERAADAERKRALERRSRALVPRTQANAGAPITEGPRFGQYPYAPIGHRQGRTTSAGDGGDRRQLQSSGATRSAPPPPSSPAGRPFRSPCSPRWTASARSARARSPRARASAAAARHLQRRRRPGAGAFRGLSGSSTSRSTRSPTRLRAWARSSRTCPTPSTPPPRRCTRSRSAASTSRRRHANLNAIANGFGVQSGGAAALLRPDQPGAEPVWHHDRQHGGRRRQGRRHVPQRRRRLLLPARAHRHRPADDGPHRREHRHGHPALRRLHPAAEEPGGAARVRHRPDKGIEQHLHAGVQGRAAPAGEGAAAPRHRAVLAAVRLLLRPDPAELQEVPADPAGDVAGGEQGLRRERAREDHGAARRAHQVDRHQADVEAANRRRVAANLKADQAHKLTVKAEQELTASVDAEAAAVAARGRKAGAAAIVAENNAREGFYADSTAGAPTTAPVLRGKAPLADVGTGAEAAGATEAVAVEQAAVAEGAARGRIGRMGEGLAKYSKSAIALSKTGTAVAGVAVGAGRAAVSAGGALLRGAAAIGASLGPIDVALIGLLAFYEAFKSASAEAERQKAKLRAAASDPGALRRLADSGDVDAFRSQAARVQAFILEAQRASGHQLTIAQIRAGHTQRLAAAGGSVKAQTAATENALAEARDSYIAHLPNTAANRGSKATLSAYIKQLKAQLRDLQATGNQINQAIADLNSPEDFQAFSESLTSRIGLRGRVGVTDPAKAAKERIRAAKLLTDGTFTPAQALQAIQDAEASVLDPAKKQLEEMLAVARTPQQVQAAHSQYYKTARGVQGVGLIRGALGLAQRNVLRLQRDLSAAQPEPAAQTGVPSGLGGLTAKESKRGQTIQSIRQSITFQNGIIRTLLRLLGVSTRGLNAINHEEDQANYDTHAERFDQNTQLLISRQTTPAGKQQVAVERAREKLRRVNGGIKKGLDKVGSRVNAQVDLNNTLQADAEQAAADAEAHFEAQLGVASAKLAAGGASDLTISQDAVSKAQQIYQHIAGIKGADSTEALTALENVYRSKEALNNLVKQQAKALYDSVFTLRESKTDNPIKIDRLEYRHAQGVLRRGGFETAAERNEAKANVHTSKRKLEDDVRNRKIESLDFEVQIGKLTVQQEIAALQRLLATTKKGTEARRDLRRKILGLKHDLAQDSGLDLDVGSVRLPTAYEIRRLVKGERKGINVTQSYATTVHVSSNVDIAKVGDAMERHHKGAGKAIAHATGMI